MPSVRALTLSKFMERMVRTAWMLSVWLDAHQFVGYLTNQFMETHSNQRTDKWGGSVENRARFPLEAIKAVIEEVGDSRKVGIKLSPGGGYNDMGGERDGE
jgi:2,4-dienoyl-CoA reductase-like NADH-dependent reductase (Old Yellow Enzyme family)